MTKSITLTTPNGFNWKSALVSHGWSHLPPFEADYEKLILNYVFNVGRPVFATIVQENPGQLEIVVASDYLSAAESHKILADLAHILRFDEDLGGFYSLTKKEKRLKWVTDADAGRLLRSPTVFEDVVKTMCTTNCSWGLTKNMTRNLVELLGEKSVDGKRAFPTASAMASVDEAFYRDEIRAGYRSGYFAELARRVADGELDPEKWLYSDLPTSELKKEMKKIKGFGDYAAENLLKLVGRYDGLALDSWLRGAFYKTHNNDTECDDKTIRAHYERYGQWRGLAIWCDLNSDWWSAVSGQ